MLPNEAMYPYTAKEARDRGELELWRANFRTNCACAGAIELAIHRDFDGMHLKDGCAKSVIDQYGYRRVGYVLANTLQLHAYDGRYHETNKRWSRTIFVPEDGGHRHTFTIGRSVRCTCLGDGETTRWNRSEFVGIIRDECLPDWAAEKLAELRQNHDAPTMGEMTM